MSRRFDNFEPTQLSGPPKEAEEPMELFPPEDSIVVEEATLQKAQNQRREAELRVDRLMLEQAIEQLERSRQAKSQELSDLAQQVGAKTEELQKMRTEANALNEALSQKLLGLESIKTAVDEERQHLVRLKKANTDMQSDAQKMTDRRSKLEQSFLEHEQRMRKAEELLAQKLVDSGRLDEEINGKRDALSAAKDRLEVELRREGDLRASIAALLHKKEEIEEILEARRLEMAKLIGESEEEAQKNIAEAREDAQAIREEARRAADILAKDSQKKLQTLAEEKLQRADAKADQILSNAQREATELLSTVHEKARKLIEGTESEAAALRLESHSRYDQILEDAKREAFQLLSRAQKDSETLSEEARKRADLLQSTAYEEKRQILEEADLSRTRILDEARAQQEEKLEKALTHARQITEEAAQKKQGIELEIEGLSAFLQEEKRRFYEALDLEKRQLLHEILHDRSELDERIKEEAKLIELRHAKARDELQRESQEHKASLEARGRAMEEEWTQKAESLARSLEQRAQEAAQAAQTLRRKLDEEMSELRTQTEKDLVQLRIQQEASLQNWTRTQQDLFHSTQNKRRAQILDAMTAFVNAAIKPHIAELDAEESSRLTTQIRNAANEAFLEAEKQTQAASLHGSGRAATGGPIKDASYWRRTFLHSGAKLLALSSVLLAGGIASWKFLSREQNLSAASNYVTEEMKKRQKLAFEPELDRSYKSSYTDNVLYTSRYLEYERHKELRNRWIVTLNRHAIDKVEVHNEAIVKLLAKEATLLKQLEKIRLEIDGRDPEPEIRKMRELEEKYRQQFVSIMGSEEKYIAFAKFKSQYFEKILQRDLP